MDLEGQLSARTGASPAGSAGLCWQEASVELALSTWDSLPFQTTKDIKVLQAGMKGGCLEPEQDRS